MTDEQADLYDYAGREASFREMLRTFVGCRLVSMRVEVIHGELNQVFLRLDERVISIHGDIGGEVLRIVETDSRRILARTKAR